MRNYCLILLLILTQIANATNVPAGNVSGTWTPAGNPYNVNGIISIQANNTLTIMPGVQVVFTVTYGKIIINGNLIANGNATDSIYFTSNATTATWQGLQYNTNATNVDTLKLNYLSISKMDYNGIYAPNFGFVVIKNCTFHKNQIILNSGLLTTAKVIVENNLIKNNSASFNSGAYFGINSNSIITHNRIINNYATCFFLVNYTTSIDTAIVANNVFDKCHGTGGNALKIECAAKLSDNVFKNNISTYNYSNPGFGSIYINSNYVSFERDSFLNNWVPTGNGAAIYLLYCDTITFKNCYFYGNMAVKTGGDGYGDIYSASLVSPNTTSFFIENTTFSNANRGSCYISEDNDLTVDKCKFLNCNVACIYAIEAKLNVTNTLFANNMGYCILNSSGYAVLNVGNCTFANNIISAGAQVSPIYAYNIYDINIYNSIFWSCATSTCGKQIYINQPYTINSNISIRNCNFADSANCIGKFGVVSSTVIDTFTNNTYVDPQFKNPSVAFGNQNPYNFDYSLSPSSPLINAGMATSGAVNYGLYDLANQPRVLDGIVDVGAYENSLAAIISPQIAQYNFCSNSGAVIHPQVYGADTIQYNWYKNNLLLSNVIDTLQFAAITPADTGNYTLIVSNIYGADTLNFNVAIIPNIIAPTISAPNNSTICIGDSITLSGNNGGTWSNGASSQTISVNTIGNYYLVASNACSVDTSNVIVVVVNQLPIASVISAQSNLSFCVGDSVTLSGNVGGIWNNNDTAHATTIHTTGTYFVTNTNSCGSTTSNTITVTVDSMPDVSVFVVQGGVYALIAAQPNASYQWFNCITNTPIANDTNMAYTVISNGTYAVIVTLNTCTDTSYCMPVFVTDIKNNSINSSGVARLFPNPATASVTIINTQNSGIEITNVLEQIVYAKQIANATETINIELLVSGIYFVKVGNEILKFVKID